MAEKKAIKFGKLETAINEFEVAKIVHYLRTELKIGIEFEKACEDDNERIAALTRSLMPSNDYNTVSKSGIVKIVNDGSINPAGKEFLYHGTNENFWGMYQKIADLHKKFKQYGYQSNKHCGMHYHLLTVQKWKIPEVVLMNLIQLLRAYAPGLMYLTKTSEREINHFSSWTSIMKTSPIINQNAIKTYIETCVRERYQALNIGASGCYSGLGQLQNTDGKNLDGLHIEFRFPDGNDNPAAITAYTFLFRALIEKAVQLSEFGIVDVESLVPDWGNHKELVSSVDQIYQNPSLIEQSKENAKLLLKFLYNNIKIIDGESISVLQKLSNENIYQITEAGKNPNDIIYVTKRSDSEKVKEIRKLLITNAVEADTATEWLKKAGDALGFKVWDYHLLTNLGATWSAKAKTYLLQ